MIGDAEEKYRRNRRLQLHRGGLYARRSTTSLELEHWLDREFQTLFARVPAATHGLEDTRRRRQHSWRVHARRVREMVFAGADDAVINELPAVWSRFIERCREERQRRQTRFRPDDDRPTPAMKAAA